MELKDPFGICFNMIKLKYETYDTTIMELNNLTKHDSVNVFINIETILNYISAIKDLEQKLVLYPDFKITMVSDLINVAAHYKEFFISNGLNTKVFLYMTDLDSFEGSFRESKYNPDYRCYYLNKYNGNPKFGLLTEALKSDILPMTKTICDFIPNVYFIKGKNMEGSIIPYIIGDYFPERKNFIISADNYENQYSYIPNYTHHMYRRFFSSNTLCYTPSQYVKDATKREDLTKEEINIFSKYGYYLLLLSCIGDRSRSIDGVKRIGSKTLWKIITQNINEGKLSIDTENIQMLSSIFDDSIKKDVEINLSSMSIKNSFKEITNGEKKQITSQIIDRVDIESLKKLNRTIFTSKEHELRLETLLK
jgi:hypothetical protein